MNRVQKSNREKNHRLRGGAYYSNNISFFTKDSIVIRVRPEIVNMFETIVYMEVDASEMIQLETIDSETLRKVIQFCEYQQRLLDRQADGYGFEDDQNEFSMFYFRDIDNDFILNNIISIIYCKFKKEYNQNTRIIKLFLIHNKNYL